ncbi:PUA-like domain-containing protein [Amanita rubescens]|nr:PUA-like domain-containing protein [Amanita rubescens]
MSCEYEKQRQINMERNRELLQTLGLYKPQIEPKEKREKVTKKRKTENDESPRVPKALRTSVDSEDGTAVVRRSARNAGKTIDYNSEIQRSLPKPLTRGIPKSGNEGPQGRDGDSKRVHDPKTFGHIPGVEVGTWWESRQGCSADAIHAPWVAGISGGRQGAYSVALSGGYEDDIDLGYGFTYTGSGGRDLKGTKKAPKNLRTAPQSSDQSFEHPFNKALLISSEKKKPVRVIRGFKLKSKYAPSEGYRYDGLYTVERAWMEKGLNPGGHLVCKYAFKRLPGQSRIPEQDDGEGQSDSDSEGDQDDS